MLQCELCEREVQLDKHHLVCKSMWNRSSIKRRFSKQEMRSKILMVCKLCHRTIHDFFDEKTLAREFNTKELLLANQAVKNFIIWAKKQH